MRKLLLASAFALAAIPALAGSLTISITSPAVTGSKSFTISDADAVHFLAFARAAYPTRHNPACNPECPEGQTPTLPNNALQSLAAWADGFAAGTAANVRSYLREQARKTAEDGVPPVDIK